MAQPQSNPKIEELRFRLKTDAKSRLFYPLAEELRKIGRFDEAEQVLRTGLEHHPTYLSAWVSLGRVLRDQKKNDRAVEALSKALQLDPGNVVAARLLGDAYLDLGDKVEAIKKYKLVHALLPGDQDLEAMVERLDDEINPIVRHVEPAPFAPEVGEDTAVAEAPFAPMPSSSMEETRPRPIAAAEPEMEHQATIETPFAEAEQAAAAEQQEAVATGDAEPMAVAHAESPFEEPGSYTAASLTVEKPVGIHIESAPLSAEVPESPFAEPVHAADDLTNTLTMADLYARQGLTDDARQIYENILQRDPDNADVSAKLAALAPPPRAAEAAAATLPAEAAAATLPAETAAATPPTNAKVAKLQQWLAKVKGGEASHV